MGDPMKFEPRTEWGSIPKAHVRPRYKDGIRRINGRQIQVLLETCRMAGFDDEMEIVHWIQREIKPEVNGKMICLDDLGDIPDGPIMQEVIRKVKERI